MNAQVGIIVSVWMPKRGVFVAIVVKRCLYIIARKCAQIQRSSLTSWPNQLISAIPTFRRRGEPTREHEGGTSGEMLTRYLRKPLSKAAFYRSE